MVEQVHKGDAGAMGRSEGVAQAAHVLGKQLGLRACASRHWSLHILGAKGGDESPFYNTVVMCDIAVHCALCLC